MKKLIAFAALGAAIGFTACSDDYDDTALWDKVNNHEERLSDLENWQESANNNIAALQQLLNTTDYITAITPIVQNGEETGYTIEFLNSDPITIYHGEKGEQGEAGKDGNDGETPQISLIQQSDGNWYWTLNGNLMTDENNNPIRANGEKGDKGDKGDASDGSTPAPQIKLGSTIDSGTIGSDSGVKQETAWYLSMDNGTTWYRISGDKGEQGDSGKTGQTGQKGEQGDSWFTEAPQLSEDGTYYIFTLADNDNDEHNNPTIEVRAYQSFNIGEGIFKININVPAEIAFNLPEGTTADNYSALMAQIIPEGAEGSYTDIATRAENATTWKVEADLETCKITVTAPSAGNALLRATLIRTDGSELTASRIVTATSDYEYDEVSNTYTIYTIKGLQEWAKAAAENNTTNGILAADIDLEGAEWTPVGNGSSMFQGTFDGGGHTIDRLYISSNKGSSGFIGRGSNCTIKNLTLTDVNITNPQKGASELGGIIGYMEDRSTVINCVVTGKLGLGEETNIGGIAGQNHYEPGKEAGSIIACHADVEINGFYHLGGIIGSNSNNGIIKACSSSGKINGTGYIGGIAGSGGKSISACYTTTEVKGLSSFETGDIVGGATYDSSWSDATASYSHNDINDSFTWTDAMNAMNDHLTDYQWIENTGDDKDIRPLIIQEVN